MCFGGDSQGIRTHVHSGAAFCCSVPVVLDLTVTFLVSRLTPVRVIGRREQVVLLRRHPGVFHAGRGGRGEQAPHAQADLRAHRRDGQGEWAREKDWARE
jgi:hypothetical protein